MKINFLVANVRAWNILRTEGSPDNSSSAVQYLFQILCTSFYDSP